MSKSLGTKNSHLQTNTTYLYHTQMLLSLQKLTLIFLLYEKSTRILPLMIVVKVIGVKFLSLTNICQLLETFVINAQNIDGLWRYEYLKLYSSM